MSSSNCCFLSEPSFLFDASCWNFSTRIRSFWSTAVSPCFCLSKSKRKGSSSSNTKARFFCRNSSFISSNRLDSLFLVPSPIDSISSDSYRAPKSSNWSSSSRICSAFWLARALSINSCFISSSRLDSLFFVPAPISPMSREWYRACKSSSLSSSSWAALRFAWDRLINSCFISSRRRSSLFFAPLSIAIASISKDWYRACKSSSLSSSSWSALRFALALSRNSCFISSNRRNPLVFAAPSIPSRSSDPYRDCKSSNNSSSWATTLRFVFALSKNSCLINSRRRISFSFVPQASDSPAALSNAWYRACKSSNISPSSIGVDAEFWLARFFARNSCFIFSRRRPPFSTAPGSLAKSFRDWSYVDKNSSSTSLDTTPSSSSLNVDAIVLFESFFNCSSSWRRANRRSSTIRFCSVSQSSMLVSNSGFSPFFWVPCVFSVALSEIEEVLLDLSTSSIPPPFTKRFPALALAALIIPIFFISTLRCPFFINGRSSTLPEDPELMELSLSKELKPSL